MPVNILSPAQNRACDFHADYLAKDMFPLAACNHDLVVYGSDEETLDPAIADFIQTRQAPILVHHSDESLIHRTAYYARAQAVIRPHFDPRISAGNAWFVPNGYTNGYANDDGLISSDRPISWVFVGQAKNHRGEMLGQLGNIAPNAIHLTSGWFASDTLPPAKVIELYRRSVFVPCPFGNSHPDSLRVCEALEWGCLPVTVKFMGIDYFRYVFGDHPFIVANDWAAASSRMKKLLADPVALAELQRQSAAWYEEFKNNLILDLADILDGRTLSLRSPQWTYQREGQRNRWLKLKFALHFGRGPAPRAYRRALGMMRTFASRYA